MNRRASESPVGHLVCLNTELDKRHERRALEVDELRRFLETTRAGPKRFGMTGYERALLYRLAAETGLRASELRLNPALYRRERGDRRKNRLYILPLGALSVLCG
jgi:hypothetical protein